MLVGELTGDSQFEALPDFGCRSNPRGTTFALKAVVDQKAKKQTRRPVNADDLYHLNLTEHTKSRDKRLPYRPYLQKPAKDSCEGRNTPAEDDSGYLPDMLVVSTAMTTHQPHFRSPQTKQTRLSRR
jgi:hypothetical protein